jgi:glycosyltransferase involved in cell wall biosynthesis
MEAHSVAIMHLIAQLRFGAGRYLVDTAIEQMRGLGHTVMVCVSTDVDENWRTDPKLVSELADYGIRVKPVGDFFHRRPGLIQESAACLGRLRKEIGSRVIMHAHTAMAAAAGYWAQADGLVVTCHGWGTGRPPEMDLGDSLAYQLCDSVTTYSHYWAGRVKKDLAVQDVDVSMMGLDLARYPQFSKNPNGKSTAVRIATVCELTHRKGVDLLLNSMPMVWSRFPSAELHITGNGDAADALRSMAKFIDAGRKRIFFHGTVAEPYKHLEGFDLFVLASRSDNLPVVLIEAMLARLPIVSTFVGGIPEIIWDAECGEIVPPESAAALADGIIRTLNRGRGELAEIGEKGECFVRDRFDVRRTAVELEKIYSDAFRNHHKPRRLTPA